MKELKKTFDSTMFRPYAFSATESMSVGMDKYKTW
jgi:hypothetical protein